MLETKKSRRYEFTNHIMFNLVMSSNEEICRGVLEASLGFEIGKIEQVKAEETVVPAIDARGVRFDVSAKVDGRLFDVEMQAWPQSQLAKRVRYYQSAMDVDTLKRGASFSDLPESFVIFICKDNPLGLSEAKTTFRMRVDGPQGALLGDGRTAIILVATNWECTQDEGLRQMLRYVAEGPQAADGTDPLVSKIDDEVELMNGDARTVGFMTAEMDRRALLSDMRKLQEARDALQNENDALQNENDALQNENDALQDERNAMQDECDALQNKSNALQDERDAMQGERDRSQAQVMLAEMLIVAGRGDEFVAAKSDEKLMTSLLEEFALV